MKKYSHNKDINAEVNILIRSGWRYIDKKKHGAVLSPSGLKLIVPRTPSDRRALYNFRRDAKRLILEENCNAM